jgi:serine/threonine-protein kinase
MPSDPALHLQQEHRPGDVIAGRYVLSRKLGEGGMGVVWIAHSTALDVDVALKMLRRELAGTPAVERMAREARTAAQLGHPAMVRVLDFGTSEEQEPFLAMELLQGEELHQRLEREKRLSAPTAVALMLPIIDGLGTAHDKGIVHRDIKPENIFIAADQQNRVQPKMLDFGIAKLGDDQTPSRLTQVGVVMGSPLYLSPEQAEGLDDIDFRCDIWAVGVVLYEVVTGVTPFAGANYNALIRSILRDTPHPLSEHAAGDPALWVIIERCLKKNREERWASMWELGEALALWLFERDVRVDAAGRSLKHGWLDGTITGVQILVTSNRPDPDTLPPPHALEIKEAAAARAGAELARTQVRPRRRARRFPVWPLAFAACTAGALLFVLWQRHTQPTPPISSGAEVSATPAVSPQVVAPATTVLEAASALPAAATAPIDPSSLPLADTSSIAPPPAAPARRSAAAKTKPAAAPTPAAAPKADDHSRHNTEFGF